MQIHDEGTPELVSASSYQNLDEVLGVKLSSTVLVDWSEVTGEPLSAVTSPRVLAERGLRGAPSLDAIGAALRARPHGAATATATAWP